MHETTIGYLLHCQDEERRGVARALHDRAGQSLSALSMNLSMMMTAASRLDARTREVLQESIALADSAVKEIRTVSYNLHPPLLDELGLPAALRAYVESYCEKTGIEIQLSLPAQQERLSQDIELTLFRIVQDRLENLPGQSGLHLVTLALKRDRNEVRLELITGPTPSSASVELAVIRERARRVGGHLTITSRSAGTALTVTIPVEKARSART